MSAEQNINPSHEKDSFETGLLPGYTRVIHSLEPVYDLSLIHICSLVILEGNVYSSQFRARRMRL